MIRVFSEIEPASLALALMILGVAVLLGYREWLDRQSRPADLAEDDLAHFQRRDRRRSWGLSILCILALGIVVGSRTPVRSGLHANPWFLGIWLSIFGLIFALLLLALLDWVDLRRYARRKKLAIGREHLPDLQAQIDRWKEQAGDDESIASGRPR